MIDGSHFVRRSLGNKYNGPLGQFLINLPRDPKPGKHCDDGEIRRVPFAWQSELMLEQMKCRLEAAGSSPDRVLKCNVYCTPDESHFGIFNEIYSRYFPSKRLPAYFCMSSGRRVCGLGDALAMMDTGATPIIRRLEHRTLPVFAHDELDEADLALRYRHVDLISVGAADLVWAG